MAKLKDSDIIWDESPQIDDNDVIWDDQPPTPVPGIPYADRPMSRVAGDALRTMPSSTQDFAGLLYEAGSRPIETGGAIQDALQGLIAKGGEGLGAVYGGDPTNPRLAQMEAQFGGGDVGQLYQGGAADPIVDHYQKLLTMEGFKQALSDDPAMTVADVAPLGQIAGKVAGTTGKLASKAISATPLPELSREILGKMTSTGAPLIKKMTTGVDEIALGRKLSPIEVVEKVKESVKGYSKQVNKEFASKKEALKVDPRTVSLKDIRKSIDDSLDEAFDLKRDPKTGRYNYDASDVATDPTVRTTIETIEKHMKQYEGVEAVDLYTAEKIRRNISRTYVEGASPEAKMIATDIKNKVRDTAAKVAPEYGEMLANISEAKGLLREFSKNVGKMDKESAHAVLNKLKQSGRDGYEIRAHFIDEISAATGTDINGLLAGYMTKNWLRPGAGSQLQLGTGIGVGGAAALGVSNPALTAGILTVLGASSPRIVGDTLRALGASKRVTKDFMKWLPKQKGIKKHGAIAAARTEQKRQGDYDNLIQQELGGP